MRRNDGQAINPQSDRIGGPIPIPKSNTMISFVFTPTNRRGWLLLCLTLLIWLLSHLTQWTVLAQPSPAGANQLTLQQCIDLALRHNISVQQGQLAVTTNDLQVRQARLNQLPTATLFGTQSFNSGRNIDPYTNQFIVQTINSSNYQLTASATLFNGFALRNTIRQNDLTRQASEHELQATRNTVTVTVMQAYLAALTATEQLAVAQRQTDVARAQLDRTQRLVNAGTAPEANLFDLRATLASSEVDIVTAQNTLDLAKVALLQAINLPADGPADIGSMVDVAPVTVPEPTRAPYPETATQVYETAVRHLPDAAGADLRMQSAVLGVAVARGNLYPTLSVSGNLNSLYSSAAANGKFTPNGQTVQVQTPYYITNPDGTLQPIYTNSVGGTSGRFSYGEQLTNNVNQSLSISLRVPIFGGNIARSRITTARIQQQIAGLNARAIRLQLRQQIETAYAAMRAATNRYRAIAVQVASLEQAFAGAESRFNAGTLGSFEYSIAKSNLDRSRATLIQAKYEYVFRTKILDFYQGRAIE